MRCHPGARVKFLIGCPFYFHVVCGCESLTKLNDPGRDGLPRRRPPRSASRAALTRKSRAVRHRKSILAVTAVWSISRRDTQVRRSLERARERTARDDLGICASPEHRRALARLGLVHAQGLHVGQEVGRRARFPHRLVHLPHSRHVLV